MPSEFRLKRRVQFYETDAGGIVHFSVYFRYMEEAEHALWRAAGLSIHDRDSGFGWPRVHASCDYHKPLRFEDLVEIHLLVAEKRSKAITYEVRFHRVNGAAPEEVARGRLTIVCVSHAVDGTMKATAIPEEIASKIEVAPKELLAGEVKREA